MIYWILRGISLTDKRGVKALTKVELWETLVIFFGIFALWPKILGWDGRIWDFLLVLSLFLLLAVVIRRVRRFNAEMRKYTKDN